MLYIISFSQASGQFELESTITLLLQTKQQTKWSNHLHQYSRTFLILLSNWLFNLIG